MRRGHVLALLVAATVTVSACGAEGVDSAVTAHQRAVAATLPEDRWRSELQHRCDALAEEHSALAATAPEDLEAAQAHAAGVARFAEAYATAFAAVDDPSHDPDAGRRVRDLADELAAAGRSLDAAAEAVDPDEADRAVQRLRRIGGQLDAALVELDLDDCAGLGGITTP